MSIAAELKRRLKSDDRSINKRLKLAENVLSYPFLPLLQKQEIVIEWLCANLEESTNIQDNQNSISTLEQCVKLLNFTTFSAQGRNRLFMILSKFILEKNDVTKQNIFKCCFNLLENSSAVLYFQQSPIEIFLIFQQLFTLILQCRKNNTSSHALQEADIKKIFNHLQSFIKSFNKKSTLVNSFIESKLFSTIIKFSDDPQHSSKVHNICQIVMFPHTSCSSFKLYLMAIAKGSDLMKLFEEKGETLRPIVTVMDILLKYSISPEFTENDLIVFLGYFISSYKFDESLIFVFNIILYKCIGIQESYIAVKGEVQNLNLSRNFVELIHLQNLNCLSEYNVNLNVSLLFNLSNNIADESKKDYIRYLQCLTTAICDEKLLNNTILLIVKQTFLLDPEILMYDLYGFLSYIIVRKKDKRIMNDYNDTLITIMEIMFKMSKGPEFIMQLLLNIKIRLGKINFEQEKFLHKQDDFLHRSVNLEMINNKLLCEGDIFSKDFYEKFAKFGSDLMSRQHNDLFTELIRHLNDCISELELGMPVSTLQLTVITSSLLSYLCNNSKIADQNIPKSIFEKFYSCFDTFGKETLSKFATKILNLSENVQLLQSFLNICKCYGNLKLLLRQFQPHFKDEVQYKECYKKHHISDITLLHSYISQDLWKNIYKAVFKVNDESCINIMNLLILQNVMVDIYSMKNKNSSLWSECVQKHFINNFHSFLMIQEEEIYFNVIFSNMTDSDLNCVCQKVVKGILNDDIDKSVINKSYICNNMNVLSSIALECIRLILLSYESEKSLKQYSSLFETIRHEGFDFRSMINKIQEYSEFTTAVVDCKKIETNNEMLMNLKNIFDLLNVVPVQFLKEDIQDFVLFGILVVQTNLIKLNTLNKGLKHIRSNCSSILLKTFGFSSKLPKVFKIFPLKLFMQLIERNYFKLISVSKGENEMFYLLKEILLASISDENLDILNQLTVILFESCNTETAAEIIDNKIQTLFLFFTILSSIKRNNLSSDLKETVSTLKNNIMCNLSTYFHNIKWKRLFKNFVAQENPNNSMQTDRQELNAYLNAIRPFCILLSEELIKTSNKDSLIKTSKALNFLLGICLKETLDDNISLYHSESCCSLLNIVLKNFKKLNDSISFNEETLYSKIWLSSKHFIRTSFSKVGSEWTESKDLALENITLIYELCSVKFFNSFLIKETHQFNELSHENFSIAIILNKDNHVMKFLWSCFLNADLKVIGKTEARDAAVKKTVKNIILCLQNVSSNTERYSKVEEHQYDLSNQIVETVNVENMSSLVFISKNFNITCICLDVISEFVASKKINTFNILIDSIIQVPIAVNFDLLCNHPFSKNQSLDVFCELFEKCITLLNKLLNFHLELLQDRLPPFLQSYRKLLKILCLKSNSEHITDKNDIEKLVKLGLGMERITRYIVKNDKQDISRIASYIVSDIVSSYQTVSVCLPVKFHIQNCAYCFMKVLDNHAIGFMMRNMSDTSRIMFQQLYDNYKKYYKYMGTS